VLNRIINWLDYIHIKALILGGMFAVALLVVVVLAWVGVFGDEK
jgi:hypothetical protein